MMSELFIISFVGPTTFPKFWGKKAKATTGVILYEPPIKSDLETWYTSRCNSPRFSVRSKVALKVQSHLKEITQ